MSSVSDLTVVIPTRNRVHLLPRAVTSVLTQSEVTELIVVDDASTDDTSSFLESLEDKRVRTIGRKAPGGAAAARNLGIRAAQSELISFLDDDDELLPSFAEQVLKTLKLHPMAGFCWCGVETVEETAGGQQVLNRQIWEPKVASRQEAYLRFLSGRRIGNCGLTVRRQALEMAGLYDERLRCAEDTDLLIRLARAVPFAVVPEVLVRVHVHPGPRLTQYGADMVEAYRRIVAKHDEALASHALIDQKLRYKIGWMAMHANWRREGRRQLLKAWLRVPWNLKPLGILALFTLTGRWGPAIHRFLSKRRQSFQRF